MTTKKNFNVDCPYCDSSVRIVAGRRLKFKTYHFSDSACIEDTVDRYPNVPTWKCPVCKNRFAVDMFNNRASTLETICAKDWWDCVKIPREAAPVKFY